MRTAELQRAIGAIHIRYGHQALVRAARMEAAPAWPTGLSPVDRLSCIGGLPRGRISVLEGPPGSGRLSVALAILARATGEFARVAVLDPRHGFDPWTLDPYGANLAALTVVRPPTPAAAGEAAVALARAGACLVLALEPPPEPSLALVESAATRSGCLVVALAGTGGQRALAHASSLTLRFQHAGWVWEHGVVLGRRTRVSCVKNKLAASHGSVSLELRYAISPRLFVGEPVRELSEALPAQGRGAPKGLHQVELWQRRSAAG